MSQNKQFIIPWRKKYHKLFYSLLLNFLSSTECVLKHNNQAAVSKPHGFKTNKWKRGELKVFKKSTLDNAPWPLIPKLGFTLAWIWT